MFRALLVTVRLSFHDIKKLHTMGSNYLLLTYYNTQFQLLLGNLNVEMTFTLKKKSKFQMGFEPTALCDLAGHSKH